jgi:hypothetical protein
VWAITRPRSALSTRWGVGQKALSSGRRAELIDVLAQVERRIGDDGGAVVGTPGAFHRDSGCVSAWHPTRQPWPTPTGCRNGLPASGPVCDLGQSWQALKLQHSYVGQTWKPYVGQTGSIVWVWHGVCVAELRSATSRTSEVNRQGSPERTSVDADLAGETDDL